MSLSQVHVHQAYGGVVPELAAREHVQGLMRYHALLARERCQLDDSCHRLH